MLTKSQARAFFLIGTILFGSAFIFLTIDTVRQNDKRTNSNNLSESVIRGKDIWEKNNCMGCHTLLGEGAYYAPDLTKVVTRRGAEWIKVFIKDPEAMFPGERKMIKYNFNDKQIEDVTAFFKWVGEIDNNGWPPNPDIIFSNQKVISYEVKKPTVTAPQKFSSLCIACHTVSGSGGNVGPSLDKVGSKYSAEYLEKWLMDPQAVKPGTKMPKLELSETERTEIIHYLSSLK